ncbi:MAG: 1-deoxy-D-xylulose-5-phosphate reductoisomerase [Caldimicrobium thiodismutans]|uniref:1-deoxy-D-xylulose 5-phosphate reductoisomerase n=1 Tax=Caldimicrobium thiodismutans TaxID=1653476 RepID=A0A2N7PKG5_9BACT|nr:MAG: 1-deoxy-D-xylulose-5-phosphate reductoisomerase [Caldimicrobium thiodismutans]
MQNLVIFGSTGSIGRSAIEVVSQFPEKFRIIGLSAKKNVTLLKEQAEAFKVPYLILEDKEQAEKLKQSLSYEAYVLSGDEGLKWLSELEEADLFLVGISGLKALIPTYYALKKGKRVALANKECIIAAGSLLKEIAKAFKGEIIPVDSEHSALFQLLKCEKKSYIKKLIITASGGPFFKWDLKDFDKVTPELALKHPTWQMGAKITIDSATLMNKGFEVLEAVELFDFPPQRIEVLVHPQSIVHSLIEMVDGSLFAHLSRPDMKIAIAYALSYPERWPLPYSPLNLKEVRELTFYEVDFEKFPCLRLAYEVASQGSPYPLILEAADEVVVEAFLKKRISFREIPYFLEKILNEFRFTFKPKERLEDYLYLYQQVISFSEEIIEREKR